MNIFKRKQVQSYFETCQDTTYLDWKKNKNNRFKMWDIILECKNKKTGFWIVKKKINKQNII